MAINYVEMARVTSVWLMHERIGVSMNWMQVYDLADFLKEEMEKENEPRGNTEKVSDRTLHRKTEGNS